MLNMLLRAMISGDVRALMKHCPPKVVYCPAGFIFAEKALVANNLMYRVCSNFLDYPSFRALKKNMHFFPQMLGC